MEYRSLIALGCSFEVMCNWLIVELGFQIAVQGYSISKFESLTTDSICNVMFPGCKRVSVFPFTIVCGLKRFPTVVVLLQANSRKTPTDPFASAII